MTRGLKEGVGKNRKRRAAARNRISGRRREWLKAGQPRSEGAAVQQNRRSRRAALFFAFPALPAVAAVSLVLASHFGRVFAIN